MIIAKSPEKFHFPEYYLQQQKKQLFKRYWLGGRKVRETTKVMATVLSWYLKMSYFSYKEIWRGELKSSS